jgi:hypothetical protein
MRTTVALEADTRDRLMELKRKWHAKTLDEVLRRMLAGAPRSAPAIYEARQEQVDAVVAKYRIRRLTAFGSRARGDGRPGSDLDLAGLIPDDLDLFDLVHLQDELAAAFGVPVDFVPLDEARPKVHQRIRRDGVVLVA